MPTSTKVYISKYISKSIVILLNKTVIDCTNLRIIRIKHIPLQRDGIFFRIYYNISWLSTWYMVILSIGIVSDIATVCISDLLIVDKNYVN